MTFPPSYWNLIYIILEYSLIHIILEYSLHSWNLSKITLSKTLANSWKFYILTFKSATGNQYFQLHSKFFLELDKHTAITWKVKARKTKVKHNFYHCSLDVNWQGTGIENVFHLFLCFNPNYWFTGTLVAGPHAIGCEGQGVLWYMLFSAQLPVLSKDQQLYKDCFTLVPQLLWYTSAFSVYALSLSWYTFNYKISLTWQTLIPWLCALKVKHAHSLSKSSFHNCYKFKSTLSTFAETNLPGQTKL